MSYGGNSGGASRISTASDAALSNPVANNLLIYNATTQKWVNASLQSIVSALPTSATGLSVGSLWLNNGVLSVVTSGTSTPVPSATVTVSPTTLTVGGSVSGSVTLSNTSTAYLVLYTGGAEQGSRQSTSGGSFTLTPASAGSYTVRVLTASSGGTLLTESATITVNAAASGGSVVSPAFYVSPSGSDSASGSASTPFKTFEKAQTAMRGSSTKTTYLRGGTYSRTTKFSMAAADSGTSWLGYPGEVPVVDGSGSVTDVFWMDYHTSNVTISGVTFQNCVGCALHLSGYITGNDNGTISGVTVSNCIFKNILDNSQYGAGNSGAIRATFATKNNTFTHNLFYDMFCPGISIVTGGGVEISQGNKITYNKFINCNTGMADSGSVYLMDRSHNGDPNNPTIINYNYVEKAGNETEIKLLYLDDEQSYVTVTNNIFCGQAHWAFQIHGGDHVVMSNNIFDISDQKWPNDYLMGLYQDDVGAGFTNFGMAGNSFTKNIVYNAAASTYKQGSMWQYQDSTNGGIAKPSVSNNIYYWPSGTLPAGSGAITDSNPKYINPNLRNPAGRDYSFTSMTNANQIGFTAIDQSLIGPQ